MNKEKILLIYKNGNEYEVESVWAHKESKGYIIDNIPFFATSISLGDMVSVDYEDGVLYFDTLIEESGSSTINLVSYQDATQKDIGIGFEELGCDWEGSHIPSYISINIPKNISYLSIKNFLEEGVEKRLWDYKEACISVHHRSELSSVVLMVKKDSSLVIFILMARIQL